MKNDRGANSNFNPLTQTLGYHVELILSLAGSVIAGLLVYSLFLRAWVGIAARWEDSDYSMVETVNGQGLVPTEVVVVKNLEV